MTGRTEHVFSDALTLPTSERAQLAERLFSSLDISQEKIDELWAREVEDRIDAFERGEIEIISAKKVFDKIEAQKKP